jgi:hypothetical protein
VLSVFVVYDIQKCNMNDEINVYMGYNEEKRKSHEDYIELRILYFIWVLETPYYQGECIGWVGEVQNIKIYLTIKISYQTGHIRPLTAVCGNTPCAGKGYYHAQLWGAIARKLFVESNTL